MVPHHLGLKAYDLAAYLKIQCLICLQQEHWYVSFLSFFIKHGHRQKRPSSLLDHRAACHWSLSFHFEAVQVRKACEIHGFGHENQPESTRNLMNWHLHQYRTIFTVILWCIPACAGEVSPRQPQWEFLTRGWRRFDQVCKKACWQDTVAEHSRRGQINILLPWIHRCFVWWRGIFWRTPS